MDREKVIKGLEYCVSSNDCRTCEYWMEFDDTGCQIMKDALYLLKEQQAVKPERDKKTGRVWLCGNCGSYVGFEDHDEDDPNEFDKFCRECGHPVLWEDR